MRPARQPQPDQVGNHSDLALAARILAQAATLPPQAQRRLVLALVRRQFGDGIAQALESARA
jgi:hypothetical protein